MEKGKKQQQKKKKAVVAVATAAPLRPEKKIKKGQKKAKALADDATPSGTASVTPSKATVRTAAPSGTAQIAPSKASAPTAAPSSQIASSKAPVSTPAPSAQIASSKAPVSAPASSGAVQNPSSSQNGIKASAEGEKKGDSGQRIAGFIFMCNGRTKGMCYQHRVFGLPRGKLEAVQKIKKGAKLFLYDYDLKLLYGVYKATCDGGLDLLASAFKGAFPAQVKFEVFRDCLPIDEATLKQTIKDNYENKNYFKPELNSQQVQRLLGVFKPASQKQQSANPRAVEDQRAPPVKERSRAGGPAYASTVPNVQNDPYASAALINRAPVFIDPGLIAGARLPPPAGAYHPAAFGLPLPNDVYHQAAVAIHHPAAIGLPPAHDVYLPAAGAVYQNDSRPHPQSSALLERYRAVPQMVPSEQAHATIRDLRSVTGRENEVALRVEHANQYYLTDRAVASTAELLPPRNSSRAHPDGLHRPVSSRANIANLPVSSLYSFAGAAPAYR